MKFDLLTAGFTRSIIITRYSTIQATLIHSKYQRESVVNIFMITHVGARTSLANIYFWHRDKRTNFLQWSNLRSSGPKRLSKSFEVSQAQCCQNFFFFLKVSTSAWADVQNSSSGTRAKQLFSSRTILL